MTNQEKISLIKDLVKHYQELNSNFDSIYALFGNTESKFTNSVWKTFDKYVSAVQCIVDDTFDWIPWFIFENKCGKGNMTCEINGKKVKVKTVEKLVEIIENP